MFDEEKFTKEWEALEWKWIVFIHENLKLMGAERRSFISLYLEVIVRTECTDFELLLGPIWK